MSCSNQFYKKPNSILDFGINWAVWLDGDTIETHEWIVPATITKESDDFDEDFAVIVLSGGTVGQINEIKSKITTADGREDCRPIYVKISDLTC